jgi:hypothetical protein
MNDSYLKSRILPTIALIFFTSPAIQSAPVSLTEQHPESIQHLDNGTYLIDFGKVAFGNIKLTAPSGEDREVTVHFGEASSGGRIDRQPPGTVRYNLRETSLPAGETTVVAPPVDERNTQQGNRNTPPAILTPEEWGVVLPFRWVEVEGWSGELTTDNITRQAAFLTAWDEDAASFESSNETLNRIWDLCKYSIKATTFAGVYVDGDRERIPYEADAYLNQLSHYYTDSTFQIDRDTLDHLMEYGTWPTEWAPHLIFMVHADYMRTGDVAWMRERYEDLKTKALFDRVAGDGLVASNQEQINRTDIVDWPQSERDGYVFTKRNTVVNAFHLATVSQLEEMAAALGKVGEKEKFAATFSRAHQEFQKQFFDEERGIYVDGVGTDHASLHANLFPLAFGLVPEEHRESVVDFLRSKGMDCSVYAAQYLMEALFENGAAQKAMDLILADTDRSWKHMVNSGTTITWEAWDQKYKPNQDWNHAWGAAPANILPRYVLGAEPLTPGWEVARIEPHPAGLTFAKGHVPTSHGAISISWQYEDDFIINVTLPKNMTAKVSLPAENENQKVFYNGEAIDAIYENGRLVLKEEIRGTVTLGVR